MDACFFSLRILRGPLNAPNDSRCQTAAPLFSQAQLRGVYVRVFFFFCVVTAKLTLPSIAGSSAQPRPVASARL